jgi:capsular polysaccharide transport system ATP-binding protein
VIVFDNVVKSFRVTSQSRKYILRGYSGELPHASIGILGPNGVGKTTLLRLIAGQALPDSGAIRREGRVSWPLGFSGAFNGSLTGAENTRFIARIYGEDTERVEAFVRDFSELGDFYNMTVRTYSSGMRARLAFGASMAIAFDTYLVDEITAVGDARFKAKCYETFKERLKGSNVIMVSHSMATIRKYCTMGGVMGGGRLLLYGKVGDAITAYERTLGQEKAAAEDEDD